MSWKNLLEPALTRVPSVKRPKQHVPFKRKVIWTAVMLLLYFFLTNVFLFGLSEGQTGTDAFGRFRSILAGAQGSILQLGIGPIVTGSIVLQLLHGGGVLEIDKNDPRDKAIYQGLQKVLVFAMVLLTGAAMTFSGLLPINSTLAQNLGIGNLGLRFLMYTQVVFGGVLILYMDEIVSKWGIGSGVGLFIIAGISQRLIGGVFSQIIPGWASIILNGFGTGNLRVIFVTLLTGQGFILPILTTLIIFTVVVYFESTRVEIPLSRANVKGARARFPIKLIYASVLPMILVRAVQANIQFIGRIISQQMGANMPSWLGVYTTGGQPVGGLFYYLNPIQRPQDWMWWLGGTNISPFKILLRVSVDMFIMVVGGAIFAIFWIETTGMGSDSVAQQIKNSGMQIPGFRRNEKVIERVVSRYIPAVTMFGGALVGFLAVSANMLGTIGSVSGTGLLLSVSITYKIAEELNKEKMKDMHPMMRKIL